MSLNTNPTEGTLSVEAKIREALDRVSGVSETLGEKWYGHNPSETTIYIDGRGIGRADFDYIAACNPDVMTELLAELDRLRAEVVGLRVDAERWRYAIEYSVPGRMNWKTVYDAWHGEDDFADAIDSARSQGAAS